MLRQRAVRYLFVLLPSFLSPGLGAQEAQRPHGPPDLSPAEWRVDLRALADGLIETHLNAFHSIDRAEFDAAVERLDARVPDLSTDQMVVEFARLVAMIGDGHTRLWLTPNDENGFRQVPILLYWLEGELRVLGIDERFNEVLGGRVIGIGDRSAVEAGDLVFPLTPRDNPIGGRAIGPRYLAIPEILQAVGITESADRVTYRIETLSGETVTLTLDAVPDAAAGNLSNRPYFVPRPTDSIRIAMAHEAAGTPPLWLRDPGARFWREYLPESGTLYVQLNGIGDAEDETLAEFFGRVYAEADSLRPRRFVLDLRHNGGGNNMLNMPIVQGLIRRPWLDRPERAFVIIGRHTFSAASHLVTHLERFTNATLVGEPMSASPNHFGDNRPVRLPHSGLEARASSIYWQNSLPEPFETRDRTSPDLGAEPTLATYLENRDPALEVILAAETFMPIDETMRVAYAEAGVDGALAAYRAYRADPRFRFQNSETAINSLGYDLLGDGDAEAAVAVFRLNAEAYPESANSFDSLGDGLQAVGDRDGAIAAYRRALEIDPDFDVSRRNLEALGAAP
ncbi:MAG: hypothetical protein ABFS34_08195 [Gemmatimonadota bacterium]